MTVTGAIKVIDLPDDVCLTTVVELVKSLEKYLAVEFNESQVTNVVVSAVEPDAVERDVIWYRIDNSGNYIGVYVFVQGEWVQIHPPPNAIFKMYGNSTAVPKGYALIGNDTVGFTTAMADRLKIASWFPVPAETSPGSGVVNIATEPAVYTIFEVVYVGV